MAASQLYRNATRLSINSGIGRRIFNHELRCLSSLSNNGNIMDSIASSSSSKHCCGTHSNHSMCNSSCHCYHTSPIQSMNNNSNRLTNNSNNLNNNFNKLHMFQTRSNSSQERDTANENDEQESQDEDENEQIESETDNDYEERIAELEAEAAKWKDHAARSQADLLNNIEMSKKDIAKERKYAVKKFSKDILQVADSLRGAMQAIESGNLQENEETKSLVEGVSLTHKTLIDTLAKHKVTPIDCEGQEFDPNFQEALFTVPTNDHPENTVVQVVEQGFLLHDRVLRSAKVGISVPLPESTESSNNNENEQEKQ